MATIRPFRALRYTPAAGPLAELIAPPYDVIDADARARLAARHPANSIHLELPTGDRPYETAAALLAEWRRKGWLAVDDEPGVLLYAQAFSLRGAPVERWGVLTALELEPFDAGVVLPHERTLSAPKADRLNLIRACRANLSPIFGLVDTPLDLAALAARGSAVADFTDEAGIRHRVWRLVDPAVLVRLAERVAAEQVFIADGHHRYETALAYRDERRAAEGTATGARDHDFVLCYLCSTRDPGLVVLPTHRLLGDAPTEADLAGGALKRCRTEPFADAATLAGTLCAAPSPRGRPRVGLVRRGTKGAWSLESAPGTAAEKMLAGLAPELRDLDVSLLHHVVLPGIAADRFRYTHDEREALDAISRGDTELVAFVPPPRVEDVLAISRAGLTMPQKSTYFHPKVSTGVAFHLV